jgi:hypothetical protein
MYDMRKTITIRADRALRALLEERAAATRQSLSDVVREILEKALAVRTMGERIGHLRGSFSRRPVPTDSWSREIRSRNWRS